LPRPAAGSPTAQTFPTAVMTFFMTITSLPCRSVRPPSYTFFYSGFSRIHRLPFDSPLRSCYGYGNVCLFQLFFCLMSRSFQRLLMSLSLPQGQL
ncbi:hypothetical protein KCU81_g553, partial [Aureobasidium melanogenum]